MSFTLKYFSLFSLSAFLVSIVTGFKLLSSKKSITQVSCPDIHPVCVFSASGDVQYIGGVIKEKYYTGELSGYSPCMCVQCIGGCSVHRGCSVHQGDIMSTLGGYHEYIGGDIMSTSGGYHEYIGGIP